MDFGIYYFFRSCVLYIDLLYFSCVYVIEFIKNGCMLKTHTHTQKVKGKGLRERKRSRVVIEKEEQGCNSYFLDY